MLCFSIALPLPRASPQLGTLSLCKCFANVWKIIATKIQLKMGWSRGGWLENNVTASLALLSPKQPHIITRNDSLYRRLYILFLCFHVRRAFRDVRRQQQSKRKTKSSNNTSIQSIVMALRVIFMDAARTRNSFSIAMCCFYYDVHYYRLFRAWMVIHQGLKLSLMWLLMKENSDQALMFDEIG